MDYLTRFEEYVNKAYALIGINKTLKNGEIIRILTKQELKKLSKTVSYKKNSETPYFGTEDEIFINERVYDLLYKKIDVTKLLDCAKKISPSLESDRTADAIWTAQGLFYIYDDSTPEICTYPQQIQEGCIENIIDSMKQARNFTYNIGKEAYGDNAIVKGWSTHYNLGLINRNEKEVLQIKPILDYFLFNPWSLAPSNNYFTKDNYRAIPRLHMAGDFLLDYNQIRAGISFLIAHFYGKQKLENKLLQDTIFRDENSKEILHKGLDAKLKKHEYKEEKRIFLFRDYLEVEYERLRKDIQFFGGEKSIQIIEAYLNGTKKTSIEEYKNEPKTESEEDWAEYNAHKQFYEITKLVNITKNPKINKIMKKHLENNSFKEIKWNCLTKADDDTTTFSKLENKSSLSCILGDTK